MLKWHIIEGIGEPTALAGDMATGEGGIDLIPLAAAGLALASSIGGIYEINKGLENRRYWDTYYRRTGRRPKYPYRSGYYSYNNYARALAGFSYAGSFYQPSVKFKNDYSPYMYW